MWLATTSAPPARRDVLAGPRTATGRRASPSGRRRPRRTRSRSHPSPASPASSASRLRPITAGESSRAGRRGSTTGHRWQAMECYHGECAHDRRWTSSSRSSRWQRPRPGCAERPTAASATRPRTPGSRSRSPSTRSPRRGRPAGCARLLVVTADRGGRGRAGGVGRRGVPTTRWSGPERRLRPRRRGSCASATRARAVGALQADLPALRPAELDAAIAAALATGAPGRSRRRRGHRHDVPARRGRDARSSRGSAADRPTGTARPGRCRSTGAWPGLRRDVDTADDLRRRRRARRSAPHTRACSRPAAG